MNGFLITDSCKQASKNFRSYRINIIFVSSRLGILRSSTFGLRLNTAMKLIYQLKGGWEPGSKMDEKSQRTGDRWLKLHSFAYRASKFDGNFLENSRQRYRWYRYIGRQNICAPLQPRYPFVSHRSNMFSHWSTMIFRKLWKFQRSWTILLSLIYDKIMKILLERSWYMKSERFYRCTCVGSRNLIRRKFDLNLYHRLIFIV